ncbi:MAG: hypothetical protein LC731_05140, partial [Acidobacteria bacterium]|nr:hypothetical protein [Acidobacteriota bacterium]
MMRRKVYGAIFALVVTGLVVAASFNLRGGRTKAATLSPSPASELLTLLPASDAVAYMDAQRALSEIIPRVFTNDAESLARVNQELDKFREHTGADARQLDSIAIGVRFKKDG